MGEFKRECPTNPINTNLMLKATIRITQKNKHIWRCFSSVTRPL